MQPGIGLAPRVKNVCANNISMVKEFLLGIDNFPSNVGLQYSHTRKGFLNRLFCKCLHYCVILFKMVKRVLLMLHQEIKMTVYFKIKRHLSFLY